MRNYDQEANRLNATRPQQSDIETTARQASAQWRRGRGKLSAVQRHARTFSPVAKVGTQLSEMRTGKTIATRIEVAANPMLYGPVRSYEIDAGTFSGLTATGGALKEIRTAFNHDVQQQYLHLTKFAHE